MVTVTCPKCNKKLGVDVPDLKDHIGATMDCPHCGGILYTQESGNPDGYEVVDFGPILVSRYKEMGITVSEDRAVHSYMEVSA